MMMMMMMTMMKINEISNTWERNKTKASTEGGNEDGKISSPCTFSIVNLQRRL